MSRLAAEGVGGAAKKCKEIFGRYAARACERGLGRNTTRSERTLRVRNTTRSARAKSIAPRLEIGASFVV